MRTTAVFLLVSLAPLLWPQPERVGPLPGGTFLLNSGWRLKPAGQQVALDTLPMSSALSPDGRYLLVLNGGYNKPSVSVLEVATTKEISRTALPDGWLGLTFTPKGNLVYVGGGSQAAVFEFSFAEGKLTPRRNFPVVPEKKRSERDFVGDVAVSPDGRLVYAAELYRNSVAVINPQSGRVIERFQTGRRPYRVLFHPDGKSLFVTSWADGRVLHHTAETGDLLSTVRLAPHPTDMVWRPGTPEPDELQEGPIPYVARLFVAAANTNTVRVIGVSENKDLQVVESINVSLTPRQPAGMTPSALALNGDRNRLFVACADANAVAVVDVSKSRSWLLGFVPTGWYPTSVRSLAGGRLVVLNGKGLRSFPNPTGWEPAKIQTGTASFIDPFNTEELEAYSKTVLDNSPYRDAKLYDAGTGIDSPIPAWPGGPSPIRNVICIVKENRTYDQVLGDMKEGNGDPSLAIFGERVTPNHHKLAREFVLLDNFYVNGDVDADGHNWATAAIAPDYVQKLWQGHHRGRRPASDFHGGDPASIPPAGYLWTNAAAAGVPIKNYGHFVVNYAKSKPDGLQVESVTDPVLRKVTNRYYRGFDLNYPDVERAKVFLRDLAGFEKAGEMPRLVLMRLANDHTSGAAPGRIAVRSAMADNDYALGMIVEAVSKSRFWPATAIFVLEDDAQDGPDHVDSHRSPAFVISPYVRRRVVDSTMYNTASVLRTMELILGLHPMTHFDAGARPMSGLFQTTPDLEPYVAETPRISLGERNPSRTPTTTGRRSSQ